MSTNHTNPLPERAQWRAPAQRGDTVPPRVMASWQRSETYGVSVDAIEPVFSGDDVDDGSLFYECGNSVLEQLWRTLETEPVSLMLTDSRGMVLSRRSGDPGLIDALDEVYLAPGFRFSEREAGTNGLALALADRAPTLITADEHYCADLFGFTCAAVPVNDLTSGQLMGTVNLSTWSRSSSQLLLALAQSAATSTAALMRARSGGHVPKRPARGEVFWVRPARLDTDNAMPVGSSAPWLTAMAEVDAALASGKTVAAVGEPGSGRAALLARAHQRLASSPRILSVSPPDPGDVEAWLDLWTPELQKMGTHIVVRDVDTLARWGSTQLGHAFEEARSTVEPKQGPRPYSITADDVESLPAELAVHIDVVIRAPALRERPDDVEPLAHHFAQELRGHALTITPTALRALTNYQWPGNVAQLRSVVRAVAARTDVIDLHHLPADVIDGPRHGLTRIEQFERTELVRRLADPTMTAGEVAEALGMSRATVYRKIARYGIRVRDRS